MTLASIHTAIMTVLSSSWATATLIDFPNHPFTIPKNAAWIRPRIKMGASFVGEIGEGGIGLRTGVLMISIYLPPGTGTILGTGYATRLEAIFRRKTISGIMFDEPASEETGEVENGSFQLITSCDFQAFVGE